MTAEGSQESGLARALVVLPWLAGGLACLPLLAGGFPQGHDWTFELVRVAEYGAALEAGQFPPYWAENLYGGYGSPVFLFYAPLFSAGAALLGWLTGSVTTGSTLLLVLLTAVSIWAMQGLLLAATELAGARDAAAARIGASFYVLCPYLLGDKLVRNADAEFAGLCLAPLALWGLLRAGSRPRACVALVAVGLALTVLAHNLTALALVGLLVAGAVVLYLPARAERSALLAGGGVLLGLGVSAFFWLPAVSYTGLIRTRQLLIGKFDFHGQFPSLVDALGYGRFFSTGLLVPLVLLLGIWTAFRWRGSAEGRRMLVGLLVAAAGLLFLLTQASTFVWELVPGLPFFQFPWRMLGPLALVSAVVGALGLARLAAGRPAATRVWVELGCVALVALNAWPLLGKYRSLGPYAESVPELVDPTRIRTGDQSVTVLDEYLPGPAVPQTWRRVRPVLGPVVKTIPKKGVKIEVLEDGGSHMVLRVTSRAGAWVRLARWYFPGWRVEYDGEPGELKDSPYGSVDLAVPGGEVRAEVWLGPPPARRWSLWVSGLALLIGAVVVARLPARWPVGTGS